MILLAIIEWGLSIFGILMALAAWSSNENPIGIFFVFFGSIYLLPLTKKFFLSDNQILGSSKLRLPVFIILFILGFSFFNTPDKQKSEKVESLQSKHEIKLTEQEVVSESNRFIKETKPADCLALIEKYQKNHRPSSKIITLKKECEKANDEKESGGRGFAGVIIFFVLFPASIILLYGFSTKCPSCSKWYSKKLDKQEYLHSTWRYMRKDGLADLRYKYNRETKTYKRYFHCKKCEYKWDDVVRI